MTFCASTTPLKSVWTEQQLGGNSILETRLNRNSKSSQYQSEGQLSQISDSPFFGSKRSAIYELHISELGWVAEIKNFGQTEPFSMNWSIGEISP
jgi:hypothetical protein